MPASTSSRKSFTQRDYVRSSTDGVGIDLYSRQDTRMYHYLYCAWEAFTLTYARARTHTCACTRSNWKENSRTRYTYGMSCLDWHRSCLSNRYVGLFSPSSALSSTLSLSARSQFYERFQDPWRCNLMANNVRSSHSPVIPFFRSSRVSDHAPSPGLQCEARSARGETSPRETGDIFIPMLGNPLH